MLFSLRMAYNTTDKNKSLLTPLFLTVHLQMLCIPWEKLIFRFIVYRSLSIDIERIKPSFCENPLF